MSRSVAGIPLRRSFAPDKDAPESHGSGAFLRLRVAIVSARTYGQTPVPFVLRDKLSPAQDFRSGGRFFCAPPTWLCRHE
jgi:hypothetical protein